MPEGIIYSKAKKNKYEVFYTCGSKVVHKMIIEAPTIWHAGQFANRLIQPNGKIKKIKRKYR